MGVAGDGKKFPRGREEKKDGALEGVATRAA